MNSHERRDRQEECAHQQCPTLPARQAYGKWWCEDHYGRLDYQREEQP